MKTSNVDFGNGAGRIFLRSILILYRGEWQKLCNCSRKESLELWLAWLACSHNLANIEKSNDCCFSSLLVLFIIFVSEENVDSVEFMFTVPVCVKNVTELENIVHFY